MCHLEVPDHLQYLRQDLKELEQSTSESMRLAQAGNDAETRIIFFFNYLEDENAAVRYAMSQNKLTGQLEGTTSMKSLNEYRPDGTLNPM